MVHVGRDIFHKLYHKRSFIRFVHELGVLPQCVRPASVATKGRLICSRHEYSKEKSATQLHLRVS